MDDESEETAGAEATAAEAAPDPQPPEPPVGDDAAAAAPGTPPRRPRVLPAWLALERLDRQWEDPTPLIERRDGFDALLLTVGEDPDGWDYLGAMTGDEPADVARACAAWLEAQLAADAGLLGRALRPRVALVPAGRLWHVVRVASDRILVIDGPGLPTPRAAARAAARRYRSELVRASITGHSAEGAARDAGAVGGPEAPEAAR